MIDTHCHILPGTDDGAPTIEEALRMAKTAVYNGITSVVATPHHGKGDYVNPAADILWRTAEFNERLVEEGIPLAVLPGQELFATVRFKQDIQSGLVQPLAHSRYLLVEWPSRQIPEWFGACVEQIRSHGWVPVVAHPERHPDVWKKPSLMLEWLDRGVLFQLTAPAVLGLQGGQVQQLAFWLCRNRWIHLLATDAHDTRLRGFRLREAYDRLNREIGPLSAALLMSNAEALAKGQTMRVEEPARPPDTGRFRML